MCHGLRSQEFDERLLILRPFAPLADIVDDKRIAGVRQIDVLAVPIDAEPAASTSRPSLPKVTLVPLNVLPVTFRVSVPKVLRISARIAIVLRDQRAPARLRSTLSKKSRALRGFTSITCSGSSTSG